MMSPDLICPKGCFTGPSTTFPPFDEKMLTMVRPKPVLCNSPFSFGMVMRGGSKTARRCAQRLQTGTGIAACVSASAISTTGKDGHGNTVNAGDGWGNGSANEGFHLSWIIAFAHL